MGRLAMLLLAAAAVLAAPAAASALDRPPPPPGAVVRLEADRSDWLLGEDVHLIFVVENRGTKPFVVSTGGDIRGTSRPVRFTVTATRADGREAPDPDPVQSCSGGPVQDVAVKPGGEWVTRVPLSSYRVIPDAGPWTVAVHHDLGWEGAPAASLRLRFRPPLPFETRFLVAAALSSEGNRWWSADAKQRRQPAAPTLDGIFHPAYLPALRDAARRGEERAASALGRITTPRATRTLVALLGVRHAAVAAEAAEALSWRIPEPEHPDRPAQWYGWNGSPPSDFDRARAASWVPALVPRIRAAARRFVGGDDPPLRAAGARLLSDLAEPEDYGAIAGALAAVTREDRAAGIPPENWWTDSAVRCRRAALEDLKGAVERIGPRGAARPADPRTEAEAFLYLASLPMEQDHRPEGWEAVAARLLGHGSRDVRIAAVWRVPSPPRGALREAFGRALLDDDPGVASAACRRAQEIGDASLLDAVLASGRRAARKGHLEAAMEAAWALGDRLRGLEILVDRLDDADLGFAAVCILVERFSPGLGGHTVSGASAEEMKAIQARWRAFLAEHGSGIAAGKVFRAGDGFVTRDLFPPGTRYSLGGNERGWPGK